MQFNDTANLSGICNEIDFLLGTDTTDYPLKEKTRNCNRWYDRATSLILQADSRWQWDDLNQTDLPIGTMSLVANQQDYSQTDVEFLKILKVECKNSSGDWIALKQIDITQKKDIAMTEYQETAGTPAEFDLVGNSLFLYPKPSYASSGGLKIYYQRVPDYFAANDTTQEPGFAKPFHRLLSYGAALDYAIAKQMLNKVALLQNEINKLEVALIEHYSNRNRDMRQRITLEKEDFGTEDYEGEKSVDWSSS